MEGEGGRKRERERERERESEGERREGGGGGEMFEYVSACPAFVPVCMCVFMRACMRVCVMW